MRRIFANLHFNVVKPIFEFDGHWGEFSINLFFTA